MAIWWIRHNLQGGPQPQAITPGWPRWVTMTALVAATLILVIPLVALLIAAAIVGLVVFVTLGVIAQLILLVRVVWMKLTGGQVRTWPDDGRRNVRVIWREP